MTGTFPNPWKKARLKSLSHTYEILRKEPTITGTVTRRDIQMDSSIQSSRGQPSKIGSRSRWIESVNAAIHSPLFRTYSPQISSSHRKMSYTGGGSSVSGSEMAGTNTMVANYFSILQYAVNPYHLSIFPQDSRSNTVSVRGAPASRSSISF